MNAPIKWYFEGTSGPATCLAVQSVRPAYTADHTGNIGSKIDFFDIFFKVEFSVSMT